ncbi:MAG: hypothetical protein ABUK11_06940 [Mariprofundaceae bacterium]
MNTETLNFAIGEVQKKIETRNKTKIIVTFILAALIFAPIVLIIEAPSGGRFASGTGALLILWLAISTVIGHTVSGILFACKTDELNLSLEMANAIVNISKKLGVDQEENCDEKQESESSSEDSRT